jgi:hypothetical protein
MKPGYTIAIFLGLGLGLLIGNEFAEKIITIIGAIFVIASLISMIVLSYRKRRVESKRRSKGNDDVYDLTELSYDLRDQDPDDKELKPGSKEHKEIGELTEMDYHHSDK